MKSNLQVNKKLPHLWSQLSVCIQETDTQSTVKIRIKTFLFHKAYS